MAGSCILRFYNGKRAETHRNFFQVVFLLVLSGTSFDTGTCESAFVCLTKNKLDLAGFISAG